MIKALTIAGMDSGGGAGITADVKTFASFNVHGMAVVTALTAQNTKEVLDIYYVTPEMVKKQIEAIAEDIGIDAAKTGMLGTGEIIKTVANAIKKYDFPAVVDPVMIATGGANLIEEKAIDALIKYLLPMAMVVTPNKYEAEKLAGIKIRKKEDVKKAAREIHKMGAEAVVIKGGHLAGREAVDFLYYKGRFFEYKRKRIKGSFHGTGCAFSAAITANLAKGKEVEEAVKIAKEFVSMAIEYAASIGKGNCPVNPIAWLGGDAEKWKTYEELRRAVNEIISFKGIYKHIPEVGMNFAYSLPMPYAKSINDVVAVEGRIVKAGEKAKAGEIKFGGSHHLAKAILTVMKYNADMRAVMNIKYDEEVIAKADKKFVVSYYDRQREPENIKRKEGATVEWGMKQAIEMAKGMPDIIYHKGDIGKEPMILIFGKSPGQVIQKFKEIA